MSLGAFKAFLARVQLRMNSIIIEVPEPPIVLPERSTPLLALPPPR